MERYEDKINEALLYLSNPSRLSPTGNNPIVYMIYQPEDVLTVRKLIATLIKPKAEYYSFTPHVVSCGTLMDEFINHHDYLQIWTDPTVREDEMYQSIKQAITDEHFLEKALLKIQEEITADPHPLLVITDLEMLHPFYMMGVIENNIYNQIRVPMLVLYPGEKQGTARSFMGIYNQDGNYRSINF